MNMVSFQADFKLGFKCTVCKAETILNGVSYKTKLLPHCGNCNRYMLLKCYYVNGRSQSIREQAKV